MFILKPCMDGQVQPTLYAPTFHKALDIADSECLGFFEGAEEDWLVEINLADENALLIKDDINKANWLMIQELK